MDHYSDIYSQSELLKLTGADTLCDCCQINEATFGTECEACYIEGMLMAEYGYIPTTVPEDTPF